MLFWYRVVVSFRLLLMISVVLWCWYSLVSVCVLLKWCMLLVDLLWMCEGCRWFEGVNGVCDGCG